MDISTMPLMNRQDFGHRAEFQSPKSTEMGLTCIGKLYYTVLTRWFPIEPSASGKPGLDLQKKPMQGVLEGVFLNDMKQIY
jgi:hypothetical protein